MSMTERREILIGIDEAGYGPKLGPLAIGATVWDIPAELDIEMLSSLLFPEFQPKPISRIPQWIPLGDSKAIYQSGQMRSLEFGIRCLVDLSTAGSLFAVKSPSDHPAMELPWYQHDLTDNPTSVLRNIRRDAAQGNEQDECSSSPANGVISDVASKLIRKGASKLDSLGVRLLSMHSKVIDEKSFNASLAQHGNKSNLLSFESITLAQAICNRLGDSLESYAKLEIQCDKHGGRNRYVSTVLSTWPELWLEVIEERPERSRYRARWGATPLHLIFQSKGDNLVAPGAASMVAKWNREVVMAAFNQFWVSKLPRLRPTAGYPGDADRFWNEIAHEAQSLGIGRDAIWRNR